MTGRHALAALLLGALGTLLGACFVWQSQETRAGTPPPTLAPTAHLAEVTGSRQTESRPPITPTQTPQPMIVLTKTYEPSHTLTRAASATPSATHTRLTRPTLTRTPPPPATPTPLPPLIAIDPGHGGRDSGACHFDAEGHVDFTESEINLALARRLCDALVSRGYRVLLTREGDHSVNKDREDVNGDGRVDYLDELQARVDMINAAQADLLLSIHQNAFYLSDGQPAQDVGGTVTFYSAERPFCDHSLRFAELAQATIVQTLRGLGYNARDRGVQPDLVLVTPQEPGSHLVLLGPKSDRIVRPCQVPGILSETLFLTNDREARLLRDPAVLDALATAYADAIDAYFAAGEASQ